MEPKRSRVGGAACAAWWLVALVITGCAGTRRAAEPDKAKAVAAQPTAPERSFVARVDERNLNIEGDEQVARAYLRQKLVALVAEKLTELGFDSGRAVALATAGRLGAFSVHGHAERIHGEGEQAGRILDLVVWDVRGELEVVLDDRQVEELATRIENLPIVSMEEVETVERFLDCLAGLKPAAERLEALRARTGDRWAQLLQPYLKTQLDTAVEPLDAYLQAMGRVALVLQAFTGKHPGHPGLEPLEREFTLAALKAVRTIPVGAEHYEALNGMLEQLRQMTGRALPGVMDYLLRDLELAWRDFLVRIDDEQQSFPQTKADFLIFLELFPHSRFYPDLEMRFMSRWYEHLLSHQPEDLDELAAYQREVELLEGRFPAARRLAEVRQALGTRCLQVLGTVQVSGKAEMAEARRLQATCEPLMPAGPAKQALVARLDARQQELANQLEDRLEKKALRDLTFFIEWERAIRALGWGKPRSAWLGSDEFAAKWALGVDAGANCRCSLDPDEPCRVFEAEGPAGGFEVVVRFYEDRLAGVDLCQVYAGTNLSSVYRFFARRYPPAHGEREATAFLAGTQPLTQAAFGKGNDLRVVLERSADSCTVRFRDGRMVAERDEQENAAREREAKELAEQRRIRIERGWNPGDCARWDCQPACTMRGRVKSRKEKRYLVTITEAEESPQRVGNDVWVRQDDLFDCP